MVRKRCLYKHEITMVKFNNDIVGVKSKHFQYYKPFYVTNLFKQDLSKPGHNRADSGYGSSQTESVHSSVLTGSEVSSMEREVSFK